MATLNIGGKRVKVDDAFLSLPPEQQQATVEEIAASMGGDDRMGMPAPLQGDMSGRKADFSQRSDNVEDARPNPMASQLPGFLGDFENFSKSAQAGLAEGLTLGFADEIGAGIQAPFRAGADLLTGRGFDLGRAYGEGLDQSTETTREMKDLNPLATTGFEVAGAIANPLTRLGVGGATLPAQIARGAATGAGVGGAYGFGSTDGDLGQRGEGALRGALTGTAFGAIAPAAANVVGNAASRFMQKRATNAAIKGAPSAADLKAAATQMFQQVDNSGVSVDPQHIGLRIIALSRKAQSKLIDPELHAPAVRLYHIMADRTRQAFSEGRGLSLGEIHNLRQIAQDVAQSAGGNKTGMFAREIISELDDMVNTLKPANLLGGQGSSGKVLLDAIGTWGRAKRVGLIEDAIYKAQNQASGFENGLRAQFRSLLRDKSARATFTKAEIEAMEDVVRGNIVSNLTKLLGKFGFGPNNMLGGTIGAGIGGTFGGIPGALAAGAVGAGARKVSEKMTEAAANRAARVVATPGVPNAPQLRLPSPPNALMLPIIDYVNQPSGQR